MHRLLLSCLFILIGIFSLTAQKQYTVELGAFQDVSQKDFAELLPLGFVYGNKISSNVHQVYLGTFDNLSKAETVNTQIKARGFTNARVLQRPPGQQLFLIQLSTKMLGTQLNYQELKKAGNIFIEQTNGRLKILTGTFADMTAAQSALPAVRKMGYKDAFIKSIDFNRLIPITSFETGIKEPLIPISISEQPKVPSPYGQQPQATTYGNAPQTAQPPATAPTTYGSSNVQPRSVNTSPGATLPAATVPNIRSRFKRESATQLQTVLKEKGFYTATIDGYYGNGTKAAYDQAWAAQKDIQKYRALVPLLAVPANDPILRWPSSAVLLAVSNDMAGGLNDTQLAAQSATARQQLYASQQPLTPAATSRAQNWAATLWTNLDKWAQEDPVHAHMQSAFRIAYYQTQVLLEDHYMNKGFPADAAKNLALATLQNMVGADLERFL